MTLNPLRLTRTMLRPRCRAEGMTSAARAIGRVYAAPYSLWLWVDAPGHGGMPLTTVWRAAHLRASDTIGGEGQIPGDRIDGSAGA